MEPKVNYTEKEYRTFMRQMGFRLPKKAGVSPWVVVVLSSALCATLVVSTVRYFALAGDYAELEEKCVQAQNAAEENYSDYQITKQKYEKLQTDYNTLSIEYNNYYTQTSQKQSSTYELLSAKTEASIYKDRFITLLHYCTGENPSTLSESEQYSAFNKFEKRVNLGIFAIDPNESFPVTPEKKTFGLGSTKQQVTDAMGMPDEIKDYSYLDPFDYYEWFYGTSIVEFGGDGLVRGWKTGNVELPLG